MIRVVNAKPERLIKALAGANLKKGQLAIIDTGEAKPAAAAMAASTGYGIVMEDCLDTKVALLYPLVGTELEIDTYQGGVLKVFADANLGTAFDINVTSGNMTLDPNDVTDAFVVLTGYDNDKKVAYGRIALADIYL
jgi:hypothetical protein